MKRTACTLAVALSAAGGVACPSTKPTPVQGLAYYGCAITGTTAVTLSGSSEGAGLHFSVQSLPGDFPSFTFDADLVGTALTPTTYNPDAGNALAVLTTVQEAATGGVEWTQGFTAEQAVGTFSLQLISVGDAGTTDAGLTVWPNPQGYLEVTLVPLNITDAGLSVIVCFPEFIVSLCGAPSC